MKKMLLVIPALTLVLFAESEVQTCKKCHPTIVSEFEGSMHKKSSIYDDAIHKAVWEKSPGMATQNYTCAECHTPNAKNEEDAKNGITCSSCHTIKDVEEHSMKNKNVYGKDPKTFYSAEAGRENDKVVYKKESSWLGLNKTTTGSPYHDIDYTNEKFYNAQACMGCHSHRKNANEFMICQTQKEGAQNKEKNCITCHMPKVEGSATTLTETKTHAFHGFAGARENSQMLAKYVELEFKKLSSGFDVVVENKAPHDFMLHPLRVAELRVNLLRGGKATALKTETFIKAIGNDEGPSMPWLATKVVKDTMLKANEKKSVNYGDAVQKGDEIEVSFGYYIVNPKALKNLNLDGNKEAEKFTVLKQKTFKID